MAFFLRGLRGLSGLDRFAFRGWWLAVDDSIDNKGAPYGGGGIAF